jgi:hypothetical protein
MCGHRTLQNYMLSKTVQERATEQNSYDKEYITVVYYILIVYLLVSLCSCFIIIIILIFFSFPIPKG